MCLCMPHGWSNNALFSMSVLSSRYELHSLGALERERFCNNAAIVGLEDIIGMYNNNKLSASTSYKPPR